MCTLYEFVMGSATSRSRSEVKVCSKSRMNFENETTDKYITENSLEPRLVCVCVCLLNRKHRQKSCINVSLNRWMTRHIVEFSSEVDLFTLYNKQRANVKFLLATLF